MLKDLILGQLTLDEARDAQLDELPAKRPAMVTLGEEAVVHHLHGDRAEALADAERSDVANQGAHEAAPIQAVVVVEAPVFGGDERLLHVQRDLAQLDVHAAYDREAADEPAVFVDDATTLGRMEGTDLGRRGTTGEATGEEPGVGSEHSDRDGCEQRQTDPVAPEQCSKWQL